MASAGVTVRATTREASTDRMYAIPSGAKSRPATPESVSTGRNTRITANVAYTTALRTSSDASSTTRDAGRGSGRWRFSRRRLTMFSTSMTASSTTSPMAMASPPSVIVFNVSPAC